MGRAGDKVVEGLEVVGGALGEVVVVLEGDRASKKGKDGWCGEPVSRGVACA